MKTKAKMYKRTGRKEDIYKSTYAISIGVFSVVWNIFMWYYPAFESFETWIGTMTRGNVIFTYLIVKTCITLFLDVIIFVIVSFIVQKIWLNNNKPLYIAGYWLTMHIKETGIRVGEVSFRQNYHTLYPEAVNFITVKPSLEFDKRNTNWFYRWSDIFLDENSQNVYLQAYYITDKDNMIDANQGVHDLIVQYDTATNQPKKISGTFKDVFRRDDPSYTANQVAEHKGRLIMFPVSPEFEDKLGKDKQKREIKLEAIIENICKTMELPENLKCEPFFIELLEQIERMRQTKNKSN